MAYAFAGNGEIYGDTSALVNGSSQATLAARIYRGSSGSLQCVGYGTSTTTWFLIEAYTDNKVYAQVGNAYGSISIPTGWSSLVMVFDGTQTGNANRLKLYRNGALQTLSIAGTVPAAIPSSLGTFRVGRDVTAYPYYATGQFADIGVWNAALDANEAAAYGQGMQSHRIRPQSLVSCLPLVRDISDIKSGTAFTATNAAVADHPRVI